MQCFVSMKPTKWLNYATYSEIFSRATVGLGINCHNSENEGPAASSGTDYSQFPIRWGGERGIGNDH